MCNQAASSLFAIDSTADALRLSVQRDIPATLTEPNVAAGLPFDDPFDAVFTWDMIKHPRRPVVYIDQIRRVLKAQGLVFTTTIRGPEVVSVRAFGLKQSVLLDGVLETLRFGGTLGIIAHSGAKQRVALVTETLSR